jgi:hypothetical protein
MAVTFQWYGNILSERMRRNAWEGVKSAASILQTRARILCNRPAKRIRVKRIRNTSAGKKGSTYTVFRPSAPGSPPALRTGFGRRNILIEFDQPALTARIGPSRNAIYMAYLEVGSQFYRPRPWLSVAVQQTQRQIDLVIMAYLKRGL